jgi:hypothetical protein
MISFAMLSDQCYNISKIQAEVFFFNNTFTHHTGNWWPPLHPHFFQIGFCSHKRQLSKIIRNRSLSKEKDSLSFETFRASNDRGENRKIRSKLKKPIFSTLVENLKKRGPCHFLIDQSEWWRLSFSNNFV